MINKDYIIRQKIHTNWSRFHQSKLLHGTRQSIVSDIYRSQLLVCCHRILHLHLTKHNLPADRTTWLHTAQQTGKQGKLRHQIVALSLDLSFWLFKLDCPTWDMPFSSSIAVGHSELSIAPTIRAVSVITLRAVWYCE